MVFSADHERVIPRHQNHIMHTLPLLAVVLDSFFFRHFYYKSFIRGCIVNLTFTTGCLTWQIFFFFFSFILIFYYCRLKFKICILYFKIEIYNAVIKFLTRTLIVARVGGFWSYPFLGQMSSVQRFFFLSFVCLYQLSLYKVGEVLHRSIWQRPRPNNPTSGNSNSTSAYQRSSSSSKILQEFQALKKYLNPKRQRNFY